MPRAKPGRPGPKYLFEKTVIREIMKKKMKKYDIDFKLVLAKLNHDSETEDAGEPVLTLQEKNFCK